MWFLKRHNRLQMAFWKQYECGMISRESVRYLLQAADDAIDSSDNRLETCFEWHNL